MDHDRLGNAHPGVELEGPYYDDLERGQVFDSAPGLTLTDGHAAVHQAILGDRLRLPLDAHLCGEVTGSRDRIAHPGLVWDVAIGQSTLATQRVIANLFYRGLVLSRMPKIGDTLRTSTEVVALRDNAPRPDRARTGLAVLRVRTSDQDGAAVLDFHRCAMLPTRVDRPRGHADDIAAVSARLEPSALRTAVDGWDLAAFRRSVPGPHSESLCVGARWSFDHGETVSSALELVRLSLNLAAAHRDASAAGHGRRLVYGGHTIGVATGHAVRAIPNLVTIVGWRSCDHLAPVFEGDTLQSVVTVDRTEPLGSNGTLVDIGVLTADRDRGGQAVQVLDLRLVGVMA